MDIYDGGIYCKITQNFIILTAPGDYPGLIELHLYLVFLCLTEMDPSLELKYRSKKSHEKEMEPERIEKRSSTPDFKLDKRRGSKVSVHSIYICF